MSIYSSNKALLFDLDGTLIDTAPDLVAALNMALVEAGLPVISESIAKYAASHGSMALVNSAQPTLDIETKTRLQHSLLAHYLTINGDHSQPYPGIIELLNDAKKLGYKLGIVTNKPARFTRPLLDKLNMAQFFDCVISGDSTMFSKPHAAPMLLAAQQLDTKVDNIIYLGDAQRDMQAAHVCNMHAVLVLWGYIAADDDISTWPYNSQIAHPQQLVLG